jgi:GT2 family glycosyltransferase
MKAAADRISTALRAIAGRIRRKAAQQSIGQMFGAGIRTIVGAARSEKNIILKSGLFDRDWYLERYPDVAEARLDPLKHYITKGVREGRDPNPFFDSAWYLAVNPDVSAARMNPLVHYERYGFREGRDPHPSFSTRYYLENSPSVAAAGINPLAHYLHVGAAAGLLPSFPGGDYAKRILDQRQQLAVELPDLLRHIDVMQYRPHFHVLLYGKNVGDKARTLASLDRQIYARWSVSDLDWTAGQNHTADSDGGTFFAFLEFGDQLNERALYEFACSINADPSIDIVYADEDVLDDAAGRRAPFYKPDWSPDTLESFNYLGPACFRAIRAATACRDARSYYDFVLRATEQTTQVAHVRQVLCHRGRGAADPIEEDESVADIHALQGRLQRTGRDGQVVPTVGAYSCYDVQLRLSAQPLISVIIPTAGKVIDLNGRRVDLLMNCLDAIRNRSTYKNLEFVIVDNGDLGETRLQALRARGCRMVTFREPRFNVSKKLNLGASIATGAMLLLLNDDIEPVAPDWIERLMEQFEKPVVGVVGAKLLYPDMTLQHVGIATNFGHPDHVRRQRPRDDLGYFFSTCGVRNFSAVTGACMMTRADVYRRLGGYNESLAISFNDVDYCFRVRAAGLTAVYAPKAELIHFESQSRKPVLDVAESEYFHTHWATMLTQDPFYNEENLQTLPPSFEVQHKPRWF